MTPETFEPTQQKTKKENFWLDLVKFTLLAIIIVYPIKTFVVKPFIVSGASMDPTYQDGQYLIVDEISYRFKNPERGEVVVFRPPRDPNKFFIKRIIGLPNETISINKGSVTITSSGKTFELTEPYIASNLESHENSTRTLKEDEYFVMGDNRQFSSDSRIWGPISKDVIEGRALVRLLPPTKFGIFPGYYEYK
jgi:signal peptidase I